MTPLVLQSFPAVTSAVTTDRLVALHSTLTPRASHKLIASVNGLVGVASVNGEALISGQKAVCDWTVA
jgi:hypothetical protein